MMKLTTKVFKKIDTRLGNLLIDAYRDTQRIKYRASKLEKNNNRLTPRKGGRY